LHLTQVTHFFNRFFYIVLVNFFPVIGALAQAQPQPLPFTKTPALGVHLAYFDFNGADAIDDFGCQMKPGIALHFQNNLSPWFDYAISLAGSFLEFPDGKGGTLGNGKKQLLLENDFAIRARLLKSPALFNPYVQAGIGWSQYNNQYGLYAPAGAGVQVNFTPDIFLLINTQYRIPVTSLQHRHFFHSIGIAGTITRKKTVPVQPQPMPLPVAKIAIQRDADGDGIIDSLDACPQVPGVASFKGCPVPDRDGDGIYDAEDLCPDVKGIIEYRGCPMPDKDMDGIADSLDKCPELAGSAVNGGCPETAALKKIFNWAAQNVFFENDSYRLLPRSFPALDSVTNLLRKYPIIQLTIEGHTDNTGGVQYNQTLSEKRAGAILQYLLNAGIDTNRLKAIGFGQQQPVADNATAEGRAANRRVVLQLR
jgi:OOP family OmpA-OmpF porin